VYAYDLTSIQKGIGGFKLNKNAPKTLRMGRKQGFQLGWEHGIHLGSCQSIAELIYPDDILYMDLKVLFIPQGFESIDQGVIEGFQGMVSELIIADPKDSLRMAEACRPDLVLVLNGLHVFPEDHSEQIVQIREMGIKTAIWFADDPYFTDLTKQIAVHYDYIFTHEFNCVSFYREIGCKQAHYLPLAVPLSLFRPMAVDSSFRSDICFIGNAFPNRIAFFNQITPYLINKRVVIIGALWDQLTQYPLLAKQIRLGWVPVKETIQYYNGAKIVINLHRSAFDDGFSINSRHIPAYSINPRTYEISACGVLQLTDIREDLGSLYTPGYDIATYTRAEDLIHQIDYYLDREEEREQIALRGLRRTLQEHTYKKRLKQLLKVVFR
jgi:spore maturation protein CgeB